MGREDSLDPRPAFRLYCRLAEIYYRKRLEVSSAWVGVRTENLKFRGQSSTPLSKILIVCEVTQTNARVLRVILEVEHPYLRGWSKTP